MQVRDTELDEVQTALTDLISNAEEHLDQSQAALSCCYPFYVGDVFIPFYGTLAFNSSNSATAGVNSSAGYIAAESAQLPLFPTLKTPA